MHCIVTRLAKELAVSFAARILCRTAPRRPSALTIVLRLGRFRLVVRAFVILLTATAVGCGRNVGEYTNSRLPYAAADTSCLPAAADAAESLAERTLIAEAELGSVVGHFPKLPPGERGAILAALESAAAKDASGGRGRLHVAFEWLSREDAEARLYYEKYRGALSNADRGAFRQRLSSARASLTRLARRAPSGTLAAYASRWRELVKNSFESAVAERRAPLLANEAPAAAEGVAAKTASGRVARAARAVGRGVRRAAAGTVIKGVSDALSALTAFDVALRLAALWQTDADPKFAPIDWSSYYSRQMMFQWRLSKVSDRRSDAEKSRERAELEAMVRAPVELRRGRPGPAVAADDQRLYDYE